MKQILFVKSPLDGAVTQTHIHLLSQVGCRWFHSLSFTPQHLICIRMRQTMPCCDAAAWVWVCDSRRCHFVQVSVFMCRSVWVPENALALSDPEEASSSQSMPLCLSRQDVWDTIPSSGFGFYPTWMVHTSHSGCWKGKWTPTTSRPITSQFGEEVINFPIDQKKKKKVS